MQTVALEIFRSTLDATVQNIIATHEPVIVRKNKRTSFVVLPLEDYRSLMETRYLMGSSVNADRLQQGIQEVEAMISPGKQ
jgi:PHD/YefM family antitoxin component YafN of YafNO toxin-antitoxin module